MKKYLSILFLITALVIITGVVSAESITFWTMNYGTSAAQTEMLDNLTQQFEDETGIRVNYEIINWNQAFNKLMMVASGAPGPDVADGFWAYTFGRIGNGENGPMDIAEYKDRFGGQEGLEEMFYKSTLQDVMFGDKWYGFPWRIDVKSMAYRTDYLEEAGLDRAPDTWDELIEYGKKLTIRDENGNVTRWGVIIEANLTQNFYNWLWQAGGEFLTADNKKSAINSPEAREALQYLYDMIHVHEIMPPSVIDPDYNSDAMYYSGKAAILTHAGYGFGGNLERSAPQLVDKTAGTIPIKNKKRETFMGGGYFGVMHNNTNVEASLKWLKFLMSPEAQLPYTKISETISPVREVNENTYFKNHWWLGAIVETIPYGRSTQHQHPAWTQIIKDEPGSPVYDMIINVLSGRQSIDEALEETEKRMNDLLSDYN